VTRFRNGDEPQPSQPRIGVKQFHRHLTYENVMSSIAVFLILGAGTAFAASHLARNSVGTKQLKRNAVHPAKIADGSVSLGKVADEAVTKSKLGGNAVTTAKLAESTVIGAKLADGAVVTGKLVDGAITTDKLANNSVIAGDLPDRSVTAAKLAVNSVTGSNVAAKTIGSSDLEAEAVAGPKLAPGSVTSSKLGSIVMRESTVDIVSGGEAGPVVRCEPFPLERILSMGYFWTPNPGQALTVAEAKYIGNEALLLGSNQSGETKTLHIQLRCLRLL
jgi:hypothetical protein